MPHPSPTREDIRRALLAMVEEDQRVRAALVADGSLFDGYHLEMQAVHEANADRLERLLDEIGWPVASAVGEDGAQAAWLIAQHAIARPDFQHRCLRLLERASERGEAPAWQAAKLLDRIRFFEGRPQVYGTNLDWDEDGTLGPGPIENAAEVDARRASVGLEPLGEALARSRAAAAEERDRPPADPLERQKRFVAWAREVGWRR